MPESPTTPTDNWWLFAMLGGMLIGGGLLGFTASRLWNGGTGNSTPTKAGEVPVASCRVEPGPVLPQGDGEPDLAAPPFRIALRVEADPPQSEDPMETGDG